MSVINSMLRDLDRRHAPSPFKGNAAIHPNEQSLLAPPKRVAPRSVIALCVLIAVVIVGWSYRSNDSIFEKSESGITTAKMIVPPSGRSTDSSTATRRESVPGGSVSASLPTTVAVDESAEQPRISAQISTVDREEKISPDSSQAKPALTPAPFMPSRVLPQEEGSKPAENDSGAASERPAAIIKQERKAELDINAERYQLARHALAQNQPERAYELLKDNPPAIVGNTDYHAVLAAVEQQLGHHADASLRYQQLLMIDQNQASWWLGLALSFDGAQRNGDALAAYRRAVQSNSLPEAARQYANARISALTRSAEQ